MSAIATAARRKRQPMTTQESARQLRRATLGVQFTEIAAAAGQTFEQWVDAQLDIPVIPNQRRITYDTARLPGFPAGPATSPFYARFLTFFHWKCYQPEKLQTRLAYALAEYFSVGGLSGSIESGHAALGDIYESECVDGTFRTLIERVTRSQAMSRWLTYFRNTKTDGTRQPDENYGREILQLYTIGLWELNLDGTRKTTGQLEPSDPRYVLNGTNEVPTYGQSDITNMARVFTGMTARRSFNGGVTLEPANDSYDFAPNIGSSTLYDTTGANGWNASLVYADNYHEMSLPKVALQGRINVGTGVGGEATLATVLDALTNHPSTAPFFCSAMIRLLTTSNPSPQYVARVASVFLNDGQGVVGNLRAVFRAILLDQEVLAPIEKRLTTRIPSFEEQRIAAALAHTPKLTVEGAPVAEGIGNFPGSESVTDSAPGYSGEGPLTYLQNPSVFGRWPRGYSAAGGVFNAGLRSPELATLNEVNTTELINSGPLFDYMGNMARPIDRSNAMTTGDRAQLLQDLNLLFTGGAAPSEYLTELSGFLDTRGAFFDTDVGAAETYRAVAAALWLSPWGTVRN